jgi:hypothetical protein
MSMRCSLSVPTQDMTDRFIFGYWAPSFLQPEFSQLSLSDYHLDTYAMHVTAVNLKSRYVHYLQVQTRLSGLHTFIVLQIHTEYSVWY